MLSEDIIEEFIDNFSMYSICYTQNLSKQFIAKYYNDYIGEREISALLENRFISKEIKDYVRVFI